MRLLLGVCISCGSNILIKALILNRTIQLTNMHSTLQFPEPEQPRPEGLPPRYEDIVSDNQGDISVCDPAAHDLAHEQGSQIYMFSV